MAQYTISPIGGCYRAQVVNAAILRIGKTCGYVLTARLAQSAERKAFNLVVVG